MKILYLEDDSSQAAMVKEWLDAMGHVTEHASTTSSFYEKFETVLPDFAVLDWEIPDGSGIDVLKFLRQKMDSRIPVLFTTQRDAEDDIVLAFEHGADDYLVKPLRQRELAVRIDALSRRAGLATQSSILDDPPYRLDFESGEITLQGQPVKLTQKDFAVARCLFLNRGKALSREYLLKEVWGVEVGLDTRTVDVHVSRVRRALKLSPENGFVIKTIFQYGYRLEKI